MGPSAWNSREPASLLKICPLSLVAPGPACSPATCSAQDEECSPGLVLCTVLSPRCCCSTRFPTCCVPTALYPLGTPFQTELRTPSDWPFLGAWRYFPFGPTSLPVEESAVGAGPKILASTSASSHLPASPQPPKQLLSSPCTERVSSPLL